VKPDFIFAMLCCSFVGCAHEFRRNSEPSSSEERSGQRTHLSEAEALNLAEQFARDRKWELSRLPTRATFGARPDYWDVFFHVKNHGGPYIVYVNDATKEVSFVVGE